MTNFAAFFRLATGQKPYPYQERFANAEPLPHLLRAPTGAGKTATAVLGWLWWWASRSPNTPRRLIYCLPMRVLVEQSQRAAENWIQTLHKSGNLEEEVPVHTLMGGVQTDKWYLHPERPAVLIGTQDMLLSRALNRGYAASRFHWPIDFGLLNNDCVWVFDEPQLMASGVSTSAQLAGLRVALETFGPCPSIWMSATLEPEWLETIDFRGKFPGKALELDKADYSPNLPLRKRMLAEKTLAPLGVKKLTKDGDEKEQKAVAGGILEAHREASDGQTLVVVNTVKRAKRLYEALVALLKKEKSRSPSLLLVHSRFRPLEREQLNEQLQQGGKAAKDRIIVATQVVEAGVDISARTLVTELAPWASIVQRMGRCNRTGDDCPGRVFWIDFDTQKAAAPYDAEALDFTRKQLKKLEGQSVSPKALDDFKQEQEIRLPFEPTHVVRRRDVLELFDTTPDLSGNDIDVSRFVRGDDPETDVQVFWRDWTENVPPADEPGPDRGELCPVPLGDEFREFLKKLREKGLFAYSWDHLDEEWQRVDSQQVRPGLTIMLPAEAGGYSILGWDAAAGQVVEPVHSARAIREEGTTGDPESSGPALTVAEHTTNVCTELNLAIQALRELLNDWSDRLTKAARWHDAGKAHAVFQESLRTANPALVRDISWAKSGVSAPLRHERKYFRHELASALAALQNRLPFEIAYLIGAHHGKMRLSIRTLPGETAPDHPEQLFALGVRSGDKLPAVDLGDETCPETELDLSPMRLGGDASWAARALKLRDELGPFRLAYLEALLRAADLRASANERKEAVHD